MINERYIREFCCEDASKIENYNEAVSDTTQTWHCHHRMEIDGATILSKEYLIENGLYYNRPARELVLLTRHEHMKLHCSLRNKGNTYNKGKKLSKEQIEKMSLRMKGKQSPMKGKHLSDEARQRMSNAKKGKKPHEWTYEQRAKLSKASKGNKNCVGKKWWNNGVISVRSEECPEGFRPGRIYKRKVS